MDPENKTDNSNDYEKRLWLIRQLQMLAENFKVRLSDDVLDLRANVLMDIPSAKLTAAILEAIRSCNYNPTPAELRHLASRPVSVVDHATTARCRVCDGTGFLPAPPVQGNVTVRRCRCHGDPAVFEGRKQQPETPPLDAGKDFYSAADVWQRWVELCRDRGVDPGKRTVAPVAKKLPTAEDIFGAA